MTAPRYPEAYRLLRYTVPETGETELVWNSRDGVAPKHLRSRNGDTAECVNSIDNPGTFAPWHVPAVGDRVFVDLTEQRARVLGAIRVERFEVWQREKPEALRGLPLLHDLFDTREAAVDAAARWFLGTGAADVLVVTAGYLEQLQAARADHAARMAPLVHVHVDPVAREAVLSLGPRGGGYFYDRNGTPITHDRWTALRESGIEYVRIGYVELAPGVSVSTVWLGIDHNFGRSGPPVIFESMCFRDGKGIESRRYRTEAEALAGHDRMVAAIAAELRLARGGAGRKLD